MKVETQITTKLILTEREATWLKGQMQNPLYKTNPDNEEHLDKEMRMRFFAMLPNPLICKGDD